jgi:hypothetical protein
MLSTKLVNEHVFNSIAMTTTLRRLRLLEANFYVKRILGLESQDVLWVLTDKGASMAGVEVPKRNWSKSMLEHDFKLLKLRLRMEGCGIARSWKPEHEIRSMIFKQSGYRGAKEKLIPDGLMSIEVGGRMESVSVELELTLKNSTRYDQTFRRYSGKDNIHAIWYVAPTNGILNQVFRRWKKTRELYRIPSLHLSLLDEMMTNPLKARLMGEKCMLIENAWTANSPAQGVSSENKTHEQIKTDLSSENHTPIEEDVA